MLSESSACGKAQGVAARRIMCCSRGCRQKPLLVCTLSTSSVVLSVHAWCGADGVALVETVMEEEKKRG